MKTLYFMDMYYPSDKDTLLQFCQLHIHSGHTPSLILLPHGSLEYVSRMYQEAFGYIHNPRRIVIFAPLHGQRLEGDRSPFSTLSSGDAQTPLGPVHIESVPGLNVCDSYAEEEYAIELCYPYVAHSCPGSSIFPVFTSLESKEDIQSLSRLMVKLKKEENDTLFIISGNFTAIGNTEEMTQNARALNELLENNAPLLDAVAKKKISGCACRMLEAARTAFPGRFRIMLARCGSWSGQEISQEADGRIWQVFAIKE